MRVAIRRIVFFTLLILLWEGIYQLNLVFELRPTRFFPSPIDVGEQLYLGFFVSGSLLEATLTSVGRIVIGFSLSVVIGSILGLTLARSKLADQTLGSLIIALQSVPSIVWLPIALLVFANSNVAIISIVILGGTWAMTSNMRLGIQNVDPQLIRAARTMGYKGSELVWRVMLPASIPAFLSGARLALAFGWRALMAAELLGKGGLGRTLLNANDFFNYGLVIGIIVIIGVIGLIFEYLIFNNIEKRILARWGHDAKS